MLGKVLERHGWRRLLCATSGAFEQQKVAWKIAARTGTTETKLTERIRGKISDERLLILSLKAHAQSGRTDQSHPAIVASRCTRRRCAQREWSRDRLEGAFPSG